MNTFSLRSLLHMQSCCTWTPLKLLKCKWGFRVSKSTRTENEQSNLGDVDHIVHHLTQINIWGPVRGSTLEAHGALGYERGAAFRPQEVSNLKLNLRTEGALLIIFRGGTCDATKREYACTSSHPRRRRLSETSWWDSAAGLTRRLQYSRAVPPFLAVAHLMKSMTWSRCRDR